VTSWLPMAVPQKESAAIKKMPMRLDTPRIPNFPWSWRPAGFTASKNNEALPPLHWELIHRLFTGYSQGFKVETAGIVNNLGITCLEVSESVQEFHGAHENNALALRNAGSSSPGTVESGAKITVVLADDHTVVRQGLRALMVGEEDIDIVGEAENGRQAIQLVKKLLPDVAVIDIAMPVLNGLEATRQITRSAPSTKVLILSSYSDDEYVQQLTEAGAAGYLVKQTAANDLLKAIREAHKGNAFFSPTIAKRLRDQCRQAFVNGQPVKRRPDYLTTREAEVLQLIAEGRANKQIAAELSISIKTVEKHRQQVMNKLNIHDVAGLTRHAIAKGIIETNAGLRAV